MNVADLTRVAREEDLEMPVVCGNGPVRNDAVVVDREGSGWTVYLSDERAVPYERTLKTFDNESDASEYALEKLRAVTKLHRAARELAGQRAAEDAFEASD